MKLKAALTYRLNYQIKSIFFFFGYFSLFAIVFPIVGIMISGTKEAINSDGMFSSLIFIFIIAFIGVSSDFKLCIQNGMSRKNIFISYILSNLAISAILSVVLLIVKAIADNFLMTNLNISLFVSDLYTKGELLPTFVFLFITFLLGSSIGSVFGIFNDRVTGTKKLIILATLIMIPIILGVIIQLGGATLQAKLLKLFSNLFGISNEGFQLMPILGTFLAVTLLLSILTYFMNIKREIKRINA